MAKRVQITKKTIFKVYTYIKNNSEHSMEIAGITNSNLASADLRQKTTPTQKFGKKN